MKDLSSISFICHYYRRICENFRCAINRMTGRKEIYPHVCEYCGICDDLSVKCTICRRWFCSSRTKTRMSHIVFHLRQSGHNSITERNSSNVARCVKCESTNVFLLGSHRISSVSRRPLICRGICACSESSEQPPWDPLLDDGALAIWFYQAGATSGISPSYYHGRILTLKEIRALEDLRRIHDNARIEDVDLKKVEKVSPLHRPLQFKHAKHYTQIFHPLIQMDEDASRSRASLERFEIDKIEWGVSNRGNFMCHCVLIDKVRPAGWSVHHLLRVTHGSNNIDGSITNISATNTISVVLNGNPGSFTVHKTGFKVESIWESTTHDRMKEALRKFEKDPNCVSAVVRSVLLGEDISKYPDIPLKHPIPDCLDAPNIPQLNPSQSAAVRDALSKPLGVIQGPAGTGKTVTTTSLVYHIAQLAEGREQILVCAPTNHACDHLTREISKTGIRVLRVVARCLERVPSAVEEFCLHTQVEKTCPADLQQLISERRAGVADMSKIQYRSFRRRIGPIEQTVLDKTVVVCCTCITAGSATVSQRRFSHVLIDEAALATEPTTLIPMLMGSQQVIMVGDHCQLRPTVVSHSAARHGLRESLYERMVGLGVKAYLLDTQYRMHPGISFYPSLAFYGGALSDGITIHDRLMSPSISSLWPSKSIPVMFHHSEAKEEVTAAGTSYLNRVEAANVEKIVSRMISSNIKGSSVGVITFYEGQRAHIGSLLDTLTDQHKKVEVVNVDGFQGREKDFIILSCVRSNKSSGIGFVADERRINVAITRARFGLILCGDALTLTGPRSNDTWRKYLQYLSREKLIVCGSVDDPKTFELPVDLAEAPERDDKENLANKNL
jgi:regulator of nonsense transcripts 1